MFIIRCISAFLSHAEQLSGNEISKSLQTIIVVDKQADLTPTLVEIQLEILLKDKWGSSVNIMMR